MTADVLLVSSNIGERFVQLADQAAHSGYYGLQDACLLLADVWQSALLQNDTADSDSVSRWLNAWPDLCQAYLHNPGETSQEISAFLRHPDLSLPLSEEEFALLEASLAEACDIVQADADAQSENQQALPREVLELAELLLLQTQVVESYLCAVTPVESEAESLHALEDALQHFANIAVTAGFEALAQLCLHVAANIQHFEAQNGIDRLGLLQAWLHEVRRYLSCLDCNDVAQALLEQMCVTNWPLPLSVADAEALAKQMRCIGAVLDQEQTPARPQVAILEDISLILSDDANEELLQLLLQELPLQTRQLAEAVQHLQKGGSAQDIAAAQRITHTLKGSAHTVGIRGIAVLAHHLEDIFLACAEADMMPGAELSRALADAADCLENMSDALLGYGKPPHDALDVLQAILDWANRIDRDGATAINAVELSGMKLSPEGQIRQERIWSLAERPQVSGQDSPETLDWMRENRNKEQSLFISPYPNLLPAEEGALDFKSAVIADNIDQQPISSVNDTLAVNADGGGTVTDQSRTAQGAALRVPTEQLENWFRLSGESIIYNGQAYEALRRIHMQLQALESRCELLQQSGAAFQELLDVKDWSRNASIGNGLDTLEMEQYTALHSIGQGMVEAATDTGSMGHLLKKSVDELRSLLEEQQRLLIDIQDAAMRTRMTPAATMAPRLQRIVRQTCRLTGKQVELTVSGGDVAVDGGVLDALAEPLLHVLRNAIDHGIESDEQREAVSKPLIGRINVAFEREGNALKVICRDDGQGLDYAAIRAGAEKRGLLQPGQTVSEETLQRCILSPHFSTREQTTQTSGRGAGMDAVYTQMLSLDGSLELQSSAGEGLTVILRAPLPLSRTHALLVDAGPYRVAIAGKGLLQILPASDGALTPVGGERMLLLGDELYPVVTLETLLHTVNVPQVYEYRAILLVRSAERQVAVLLGGIPESREIVVKNIGPYVPKTPGLLGVAVLGDGAVAPVLDLPVLLHAPNRAQGYIKNGITAHSDSRVEAPVLLVDDSLSQRRALEQLLTDAGYPVQAARDGVEAAEWLAHSSAAIVLTDLEMPRMNGIELTAHIRSQDSTRTLPVIMITSRTTQKHRRLAEAAGIDGYIAKPVQSEDLLAQMQRLTDPAGNQRTEQR